MNQTRLESLAEVTLSTAIGYSVALAGQLVIFPLMGLAVSFSQNLWIGLWFTLLSIARGYAIRRLFNHGYRRVLQALVAIFRKVFP